MLSPAPLALYGVMHLMLLKKEIEEKNYQLWKGGGGQKEDKAMLSKECVLSCFQHGCVWVVWVVWIPLVFKDDDNDLMVKRPAS